MSIDLASVAVVEPTYISVDVETAGPIPARYSLLSLGACCVYDPAEAFYVELRPEHAEFDPASLAVSGLAMDALQQTGEAPESAFPRFAEWVDRVTRPGSRPVFVAFNAPFDWMFVADALHRHAGRNPFGHAALDIKALTMGAAGVPWSETSFRAVAARYGIQGKLPHHALEDARLQAEILRRVIDSLPGGAS